MNRHPHHYRALLHFARLAHACLSGRYSRAVEPARQLRLLGFGVSFPVLPRPGDEDGQGRGANVVGSGPGPGPVNPGLVRVMRRAGVDAIGVLPEPGETPRADRRASPVEAKGPGPLAGDPGPIEYLANDPSGDGNPVMDRIHASLRPTGR